MRPYLKKKPSQKRAGGVSQDVSPEFKPQYWKKKCMLKHSKHSATDLEDLGFCIGSFFFLLYVHICQCGVITYIGYIYKFKKMSYLELVSVQNKYTPNLYKVEAGLLDRTSISYCI
jgi:hypothetical protein